MCTFQSFRAPHVSVYNYGIRCRCAISMRETIANQNTSMHLQLQHPPLHVRRHHVHSADQAGGSYWYHPVLEESAPDDQGSVPPACHHQASATPGDHIVGHGSESAKLAVSSSPD
jgi:hypothetical protein